MSRLRVSSVLNDDSRAYGRQHLLDDRDDTCWNSAAGAEQYVLVQLEGPAAVHQVQLMFQGGFVAQQCDLCSRDGDGPWATAASFYPADSNALQAFSVDTPAAASWALFFRQPTDFFGRITLYRLHLLSRQ